MFQKNLNELKYTYYPRANGRTRVFGRVRGPEHAIRSIDQCFDLLHTGLDGADASGARAGDSHDGLFAFWLQS